MCEFLISDVQIHTINEPNNGMRVSQLAKILTYFPDWWRSLNYEMGKLFYCREVEGDTKHNTLNTVLNTILFQIIF